ncbi:MAG: glycosyltransferase [Clostridia bacterium]|nr:glycosyltransferase [Clostridia bacterium]
MKILILTSSMDAGGAETHIFTLASCLCALGEEVTVASSGGRLAVALEKGGIPHVYLPLHKRSLACMWEAKRTLRALLREGGFDVIHAHARISAFLASKVTDDLCLPLVTTVHARFSLSPMYRRLSRWGCLSAAVSEDLKQYLSVSYGVSSENIRVIENGIDTSVYFPSPEKRKRGRVVFISRLDGDCSAAALSLCNIAKRLSDSFEGVEIIICGGGDMLGEIQKRADGVNALTKKQTVRVLGHIEDTSEILQSADVFVGVSRAAIEAIACGALTVLAGNEGFSGFADSSSLLGNAKSSNLCCRGEPRLTDEGLFSEIFRALSLSEDERLGIAKIYSEYISENHSAMKMAKKTLEMYRDASELYKKRDGGKIVIGGYYGFGNMGDNALLRASLARARKCFENKEISALTDAPKRDRLDFGVRCVSRRSPLSVIRELRGADALIFGGGTLLQDRTSLRSLIYYVTLIRIAHRCGARVELWGNGLTRPQSSLSTRLVCRALSDADHIGLRDMSSVTEALRIVSPEVGDKLYLEPDLALAQRGAESGRVEYLQGILGLRDRESAIDYAVIAPKGSSQKGYIDIFERCLYELAGVGLRLVLLPMFPAEDMSLCKRLCESLGATLAEGISESDAVGLMKDARIVCGMRLHALVFASAASAPFVGFGDDPKIESFCKERGGVYFTEVI